MSKKSFSDIKFGTDGWRGVISDNFTFKNVALVAQAISDWVKKDCAAIKGRKCVAVGYDARFLSREYAETVSSILAGNNIEVLLSKNILPTPALSLGARDKQCVAGVMITASHNPAQFNGIKIKTKDGGGATNDITGVVESYLGKTPIKMMSLNEAHKAKKLKDHDFMAAYIGFMKKYVDFARIKSMKFKIVQDVMYGSGRKTLQEVLKGTNVKADLLRAEINPSFGGVKPEPIEENVPELIKTMRTKKYDLGLILDGDADRIAAVAPGGEFINPQKILALLTLHLIRNKGRKGGVVKTICGSTIMDHISKKLGIRLYETPVGFKYISHLMVTERIVAGGEEAGGMGVQDYIPERDGILAGLLLLEMMVYQKKNIKELLKDMEKEFGRYYYLRSQVEMGNKTFKNSALKKVRTLLGKKVVDINDSDGIKLTCEDESWLMLRPSGTEPLVRSYAESKSLKQSQQLLALGAKLLLK